MNPTGNNRTNSDFGNAPGNPTVLVVGLSGLLCQVVRSVARKRCLAIQHVKTAGEAITFLTRNNIAALVTSVQLEGVWGISLLAALKTSPAHRDIPIALVSSDKAIDKQLQHHLPTAVIHTDEMLTKSLQSFFARLPHGRGETSVAKRKNGPLAKYDLKVLLAEDAECIRKLIERILSLAGASVTLASNGLEAVKACERESYDVILMDLQMPIINGFKATSFLRNKGIETPIIALTAQAAPHVKERALRLGFTDLLVKPAKKEVLIETCLRYAEQLPKTSQAVCQT